MKKLLQFLFDYCKKWRISINKTKSKWLAVGIEDKKGKLPDCEKSIFRIPHTSEYKYLGVMVNESWNWSSHIRYIVNKVNKKVSELKQVIFRNEFIDSKTKLQIWKSMILPIILYASEVWWTNKKQLLELERIQLKVGKWILGCCDKTSNEVVLGELGLCTISSLMDNRKLNWYLRCSTLPDARLVKQAQKLKSSFRGPRRSHDKVVESLLKVNDLTESFHDYEEGSVSVLELRNLVKARLSVSHYQKLWDELNRKTKCSLYQSLLLDDMGFVNSMKVGKARSRVYVNKLTPANRLKFKLISGTHGLRSELSRRDKGDNSCICCNANVTESAEHFLLECPLFQDIRDDVLCNITNISKHFRDEWLKGDDTHRCVMLLRDYGAFVSKPLISIEMAMLVLTYLLLLIKFILFLYHLLFLLTVSLVLLILKD